MSFHLHLAGLEPSHGSGADVQAEPKNPKGFSGGGNLSRTQAIPMLRAALMGGVAADGQPRAAIPQLASAQFGWLADREFLPPASGPGPVTFDRAYPYVRNNTVGQPTFRIADTSNPVLQPWVVVRMNADNRALLRETSP